MTKNKNGFTLIELLVVLGLSTIIISLVMTFFIWNINNYENISDDSELQFQAQYILNFMVNKVMESSRIELIRENIVSHLYKSGEQKVTKISFRYGDSANQCYNFEVKNYKIFYGNGLSSSSASIELGVYVKEMKVTTVPETAIFKDTKAIKIKLLLEKENQKYEAEQTVLMRNY